jgi:ribose-phosphate pyrophosphokinase
MQLFSGSSNLPLTQAIASQAKAHLGETHLASFPNSELQVKVGDTEDVAIVVQSFSSLVHTHIFEYLLMCDALRRHGAHQIVSIIPWFGYAKQDKVFSPGEPLSAKVIAQVVQLSKTSKVITMDLHNPSITGYFDIPVINTSAFPLFADHVKNHPETYPLDECVVIAPDAGAIKSSTKVAHELGVPIAYMNKIRDLTTGVVNIVDIDKSIAGKHCLIFDDMIASGSTMVEASQFLMEKKAASVAIFATHHLYVPGVQEKLDASPITSITVTDTIAPPKTTSSKKLEVISSAAVFAQALKTRQA